MWPARPVPTSWCTITAKIENQQTAEATIYELCHVISPLFTQNYEQLHKIFFDPGSIKILMSYRPDENMTHGMHNRHWPRKNILAYFLCNRAKKLKQPGYHGPAVILIVLFV